jgi:hypothetical protein
MVCLYTPSLGFQSLERKSFMDSDKQEMKEFIEGWI